MGLQFFYPKELRRATAVCVECKLRKKPWDLCLFRFSGPRCIWRRFGEAVAAIPVTKRLRAG